MGALGTYVSQECHVVNLIPPASYSSTQTSQAVNMKGWRHASIILQVGSAGTPPAVTLESSNDESPESTTPIPFNMHSCETAYNASNGDVLSGRNAETDEGFTPVSTNNTFYVIELDADTLPEGQNYFRLLLTSPTSCFLSAAVILSGGRYEHDQSETVLV
jgi:hypothetical protein